MSSLPYHCTRCPKTWDYYDEKTDGSDKMSIVQFQGLICPQCGAAGVAGASVEFVSGPHSYGTNIVDSVPKGE